MIITTFYSLHTLISLLAPNWEIHDLEILKLYKKKLPLERFYIMREGTESFVSYDLS